MIFPFAAEKCNVPLAPCPERLRKYIRRLNQESGVHAQHLKLILQAIQDKQTEYVADLSSKVTIDLTTFDYRISNDLTEILRAVDPPELIARIRECKAVVKRKICGDLFWAGRDDKKACDKHGGRVRQKKHRRDIKSRKFAADIQRRKDEATKTFDAMTTTKRSVIRAIMVKDAREFWEIDGACWHQFNDDGRVPRSTWFIRNSTHRLYKDGYLEYAESADKKDRRGFSPYDRYTATPKLTDLWNDADIQALGLD